MIENMIHRSTVHEVLIAVFQVRTFTAGQSPELGVLLWQRALEPELGSWSLPGGVLESDEDLPSSARRQLAEKVDVRKVAHLEQLSIFSDPDRVPGDRRIASTFLGLVPISTDPKLPEDTEWHPVARLPDMSFDHRTVVRHARARLVAKLSYTNIAFALAPVEFAMSTLREIYAAALDYQVDATNLQRVLGRRKVLEATGKTSPSGKAGGRPPALFRFADASLRVTDEFAALRPPS